MANKATTDRKTAKCDAIIERLNDIRGSERLLISMLDETKLDLMILALGIGAVELRTQDPDA